MTNKKQNKNLNHSFDVKCRNEEVVYCKMSISRQSLCYQMVFLWFQYKWISIKEKLLIVSVIDNKHQILYY